MDDRAEFEQWALDHKFSLKCVEGLPPELHGYPSATTQAAWLAWQAATARQRERDAEIADDIAEFGRYHSDTKSGFVSEGARLVAEAIRRQT